MKHEFDKNNVDVLLVDGEKAETQAKHMKIERVVISRQYQENLLAKNFNNFILHIITIYNICIRFYEVHEVSHIHRPRRAKIYLRHDT